VSRWATFLTFGVGFLLAFGGTAVFGYLGENPVWLWCLFVLFGFWLFQLPALGQLDPKLTVISAYGFTFLFLWLASNPEPSGTIKTFVFQMVFAGIGLAALVSLAGVLSFYRKQASLRPVLRALVPLFVCGWLVAFFSSSTGAAHHMIDAFMKFFHLDHDEAQTFVLFVRKSLHLLFYGTLGLFAFRAALKGGAARKAVILGLAAVLMHACFDEIRQVGYADRTGSFWDVCLDMAGGLIFVLTASAITKKKGGQTTSSVVSANP
jgi:VanZ family protein